MRIDSIRISGFEDPIGYDLSPLTVSWKVRGAEGEQAVNSRIRVATDAEMQDIVFEKQGAALNSAAEPLDLELQPCTRYYLEIYVQSDAREDAVSEPVFFETGKMDAKWAARWIGGQEGLLSPEFRKIFQLEQPAEWVEKARLYITGLGLFEASLNGKKAGVDVLAPFVNDYDDHVQVCTYDVTGLLESDNEFRVVLGNGWYKGKFGLSCAEHPERPYGLLAELVITYVDGTTQTVGTDDTFETRDSRYVVNSIYDGEIQDNHKKAVAGIG